MSLISICIINMSELYNVLFILEKSMYLFDMVTVHYCPRQQPNRAEEVLCPTSSDKRVKQIQGASMSSNMGGGASLLTTSL